MPHKGEVEKPDKPGKWFSRVLIVFFIVGILLTSLPSGKDKDADNNSDDKKVLDVVITKISKRVFGTEDVDPTKIKWEICWEEPKRAAEFNSEFQRAPCAPGPKTKRVVDIKEYNSARFVFTVSWKERGVFKERALFRWDKIANPTHGTWHQLGSTVHKDSGKWRLVPRKDMFVGWHSSHHDKHKEYVTTMEPIM